MHCARWPEFAILAAASTRTRLLFFGLFSHSRSLLSPSLSPLSLSLGRPTGHLSFRECPTRTHWHGQLARTSFNKLEPLWPKGKCRTSERGRTKATGRILESLSRPASKKSHFLTRNVPKRPNICGMIQVLSATSYEEMDTKEIREQI